MKKILFFLAVLFGCTFMAQGQIVINEIMYNSPEAGNDSLEYIEFYNNSNVAYNLNNHTITGVLDTFDNISIPAFGYLVIAKNASAVQNNFDITGVVQWATPQALSNSGETIALFTANGVLVDSVRYGDGAPWDEGANGGGGSLELCTPTADNSLALSWVVSGNILPVNINSIALAGTPGTVNSVQCPEAPLVSVATNDSYTVPQGNNSIFAVLGNDVLIGSVVIGLSTTTISVGTLAVSGQTITFTGNGQCGEATFNYTISNNLGADTATVTVNVTCAAGYPAYGIGVITTTDAAGVLDSVDVVCEVSGIVHGINFRPSGLQLTIIDSNNNGIGVFSGAGNFGYTVTEGDLIKVRGEVTQFNGLAQILADTAWLVSANNTLETPATILDLDESTESQVVRFDCVSMTAADWDTTGNPAGFNVALSNGAELRIDRDMELYAQPFPGAGTYSITGIGGQFDNTSPYLEGYQLLLQKADGLSVCNSASDIVAVNFVVRPNPTTDFVEVVLPANSQSITVFGLDGRHISTLRVQNDIETLDFSNLPAGTYTVVVEGSFGRSATSVIKR